MFPAKLNTRIGTMVTLIEYSDAAPTQALRELTDRSARRAEAELAKLDRCLADDVARFNALCRDAWRRRHRPEAARGGLKPMAKRNAPVAGPEDEIRIENRATYWPVAPVDLLVAAPLVAKLLFRASPIGRIVQAVTLGAYLGSVARDWRDRRKVLRIAFLREFGADLRHLVPMPREVREREVAVLAARLNEELVLERIPRREAAVAIERHLTDYIAGITGQRVRTSAEVRGFALVGLALPFALGACDVLSGDVAIFRDTGLFEPHIIAHEFSHRRGYWNELDAQVLAYQALVASGEPAFAQSALFERFYRNLRVLAGGDEAEFQRLVAGTVLRPELRDAIGSLRPPSGRIAGRVDAGMRRVYDARMRVMGQNGISDYDAGFTNFLYTFETSATARQVPPPAGALHRRPPAAP